MRLPTAPTLRRCPALLTLLLVALACVPSAASATEIGVNIGGPPNAGPQGARYLASLHPAWAREWLRWDALEPSRGALANDVLTRMGQTAAAREAAGTKTEFVVVGSPAWASGSTDPHAPPLDSNDMAAFLSKVASNPALHGHVAAYEIWNEEDTPLWMAGAPNPALYAGMLRTVYPALKAADPSAAVLVGGLTGNDYAFLDGLYANGAKGSFDGVAVHTDTACGINDPSVWARDAATGRVSQWSFTGYREVYRSMVNAGDGDKAIWMTELGWNTSTKRCDVGAWAGQKAGGVSEADQAKFLTRAYACLAADPYVKMAAWFDLQDTSADDQLNTRYGLLRPDGTSKPAAAALLDVAKGVTPDASCGGRIDAAPPALSLLVPGTTIAGELPLAVRGTDDLAVRRIEVLCDGRRVRFFNPTTRPSQSVSGYMDWLGARSLPPGPHTLTARLYDEAGHVTEKVIPFVKVPAGTRGAARTKTTMRIRKRKVTISVRAGSFHATGQVTLMIARKVGGHWKTFSQWHRNARRTVVVALPPAKGALRVWAQYGGSAPYAPSSSGRQTVRGSG